MEGGSGWLGDPKRVVGNQVSVPVVPDSCEENGNVMVVRGSRDVAVLAQSMLEAKDVGEGRSLLFKFSESRNCNEISPNLCSSSKKKNQRLGMKSSSQGSRAVSGVAFCSSERQVTLSQPPGGCRHVCTR